jgi:hypothetical protein
MKYRYAILAMTIAVFSLFSSISHGQGLYTGIWRSGSDGYYLWNGATWQDFNVKWDELAKQNLRLVNIKTYKVGSSRVFSGVWRGGSDAYALTPLHLDWAAFNKFWSDASNQGLRLINIETYVDDGVLYFLGVFRAGNDAYALTPLNLDWAAFNTFWSNASKEGLRLINIESYVTNGKRYYLGVFRQGNDGYVLSGYGGDWNKLVSDWTSLATKGFRLIDVETFVDNGNRIYMGVWREGSDGYYLWGGVDWESFVSKWAENGAAGLRLVDMETFPSNCDANCLNHVLMPDDPSTPWRDGYDYGITAGPKHCEGPPDTCPVPGPNDAVIYSWPNLQIGSEFYARNSVLFDAQDQIFTLPFKIPSSTLWHNAWMYGPGSWHHAIDYQRNDRATFEIAAAAPGKVIHVGWDWWSGNTMVISHDVGGKIDAYRTIYMHLQNGPDADCDNAWTKTLPNFNPTDAATYTAYLNSTGCTQSKRTRALKPEWWGTDAHKIDASLVGKTVTAGQIVAWSGSTGPGGCGCMSGGAGPNTHLHIFFAHRDPSDSRWYFIDPYGIYSYPDFYPTAADGASNKACVRYGSTWKLGDPHYAP